MDVDACIRENITWAKLSDDMKTLLGNSQREYDKMILEYSVKNQLRYKGNLVRHVKKNEEMYYDMVIKYSSSHLMLFPYHLADIVVKELRITPFTYYLNILMEMLNAEKSYDSLPNFTAADAMRLLGIGRNQYIDLMNQNRSNRKFLRRSKPLRELLPTRPAKISVDPWWLACAGNVLESDIKMLSDDEKRIVDLLLDEGPQQAGLLPTIIVQTLFNRGLIYFDVPVSEKDTVYVGPLDGFVMNRVLGDYFETLLYKIFVAIDDQTTVKEMSEILHIDYNLVVNAISVFCRLGFARKRVTGMENARLHYSWAQLITIPPQSPNQDEMVTSVSGDFGDLSVALASPAGDDDEQDELSASGSIASFKELSQPTSDVATSHGRAAFVFDSTLAAFLMMGNLSSSLKGHAVTLFEVGKLGDEQMKDFMEQLECVNRFGEGEAQRYSEHAVALLDSLRSLKKAREVDLLRGESLLSLDMNSRLRVLNKSYGILVAMAPLSWDACTIPVSSIPFIGPPMPEVCSPWFRLAMYRACGSGPESVYFPRGTRVPRLPKCLEKARRLLVSTLNHEPQMMTTHNALMALNDLLLTTPLFVQEYAPTSNENELVHVPFPFDEAERDNEAAFSNHTAVKALSDRVGLRSLCGYVTLLRRNVPFAPPPASAADTVEEHEKPVPSELPEGCTFSDFVLLDCVFGIPLFNAQLNKIICERISKSNILGMENRTNIQFANKALIELVTDMLTEFNCGVTKPPFWNADMEPRKTELVLPVRTLSYTNTTQTVTARA